MSKEKQYVDIAFIKSLGTMRDYDIDAVEALYPGVVDQAIESNSRKFDERAVPKNESENVKRHVAALVVADLWARRGTNVDSSVDVKVQSMKQDALGWLSGAKTVDEVRKSAAPPPAPLHAEEVNIPPHGDVAGFDEAGRRR